MHSHIKLYIYEPFSTGTSAMHTFNFFEYYHYIFDSSIVVQNLFTNYKKTELQPQVKHFIWSHHLYLALICPFHASIHNFHPKRNMTCSNDGYTDRRIPLTAKTAVKDELPAELVAVHV